MKERTVTVGFRLDASTRQLLAEEAKKRGLSPGGYARLLVTEALLGTSEKLLLEEVRETRGLVARLGSSLKVATVAILADAGKASVDEAEDFVRQHMN
jgi:hypothetical protein